MHVQPRLVTVYRLLNEGSTVRARAACRRVLRETPENAMATHLLGLIERTEGHSRASERFLRKSIELEPAAAGFRTNLGNLLLELGRAREAERTYREALALEADCKPARTGLIRALIDLGQPALAEVEARELTRVFDSDPESWSLLATTFKEQGRIAEAESLFEKTVSIAPRYAAAHHELGAMRSRMERPEEALRSFQRAVDLGDRGTGLALDSGRAYLQLYRLEEAERAFASAVKAEPSNAEAQLQLARTRFMRGDPEFARDVVKAAETFDGDALLCLRFAILLRHAGLAERAAHRLEAAIRAFGRRPDLLSALAALHLEAGRPGRARPLVVEAARANPDDAGIVENAIAVLLACGEPELASYYVARQRSRQPLDQGWIAYEAVVARLLDPGRYGELYDFGRLIRSYELPVPAGFASLAELNAALCRALDRRHTLQTLPVEASHRCGSRTTRSLLTEQDAALGAFFAACREPLRDYLDSLGRDERHPVSARNTGEARLADAWSVRLHQHGRHVNHFHRSGWISSAYYVATPDEVEDSERMPGWIRFGEPRFPVPGVNAERCIRPVPGRLVLFPSCMWHGTNPLTGVEPRTAISFDALPRPRGGG